MYKLILLVLVALITGCATQLPKDSEIRHIPRDRLFDTKLYQASKEREIPVKITRDKGFFGHLAVIMLKIDGKNITTFHPSEGITIFLSEGGYVVELINTVCQERAECTTTHDVVIKSGINNNFRIHTNIDDGLTFRRMRTSNL